MMKSKIAVIVLTYNGEQYLPELFGSLAKTTRDHSWELIVVDNASTDGTADMVGNFQFPSAPPAGGRRTNFQFIENEKNLGFAAGNNVGIRKALADGAEYIILLNQDTVVEPDWLSELVATAESDTTIGAVQARLMLWGKENKVNSLGNEIHYLGFGYSGHYREYFNSAAFKYLNIPDITYASGAAALYRAKALNEVGLFDESLFMYHDDLDLGWRLWRGGWRSVLAPKSVVYHKYEFSRSIKKYYLMERNRFLVLLENYSLRTLILIFPALLVMELGIFVFTLRGGWWKEKFRSYGYFFRLSTWRMIACTRREKQKKFRRPEKELVRRFVGVIAFQDIKSSILKYIANPMFNAYWKIVRKIIFW